MSLYSESFMAYAKNPPNKHEMPEATVRHFEENRNCGDALEVFLKIAPSGEILDFSFNGNAAIVTTACASMFGEAIVGMNIRGILSMDASTIREIIGMEVSPRRRQASVLGLLATRNAIHTYLQDGKTDDFSDVLPD